MSVVVGCRPTIYSSEDMLTRLRSRAMDYPNSQYHAYKYCCPRWQKTQITFFASCVKAEHIKDHASETEKAGIILTAQRTTSNGNQTLGSFSNVSEDSYISETTSLSSSFDETDDVFLTKPKHRPSEPSSAFEPLKRNGGSLLGRFGRRKSNKLRSLSEGGTAKEKSHDHRKLTRSTSNSESGAFDSNRSTTAFNFVPQVVRKISLRTSLQDWLESEKKLRDVRKTIRTSRTSDSSSPKDNKKHLRVMGRSKSLSPEPIVRGKTKIDWNNNTSAANHVYRRFSADSVDKSSRSQSFGRRPSAPPSLSGGRESDDGGGTSGHRKNAVVAQTVTTSLNIRRPAMVACRNSDVKYDNAQDFHIQCVMKEELRSRLAGLCFCADSCREWCEEISEVIKERVQLLSPSPCKVVCTIYIGALRDSGIHSATQALLDYKLDNHASCCYQNESLFAVASVFAVRYSGK